MSTQSQAQKEAKKRYREKNKELIKEKAREYYKSGRKPIPKRNLEVNRNAHYKYKYGITLEQYNDLLTKQEHRCAICGDGQWDHKRSFSVDHDHKTGQVRGLLCLLCNTALGKFKDSQEILDKAKLYLLQYGNGNCHETNPPADSPLV